MQKLSPTIAEVQLAQNLLWDEGFGKYVKAFCLGVTVLIDDGEVTDEAITTAVTQIATKFLNLEV